MQQGHDDLNDLRSPVTNEAAGTHPFLPYGTKQTAGESRPLDSTLLLRGITMCPNFQNLMETNKHNYVHNYKTI